MATTDYDFVHTRNQIIQRAFRIVGALSNGQNLTAEKLQQGIEALNSMVKSWQSETCFLWTLEPLTFTTTATDYTYVLDDDPQVIAIDGAWWVNGDYDDPIDRIAWRTYQDIDDKTKTGKPIYIAIDNKRAPTAYIWPIPDATYTIKILAITKLQDFDSASGTGDFPVRFTQALEYGLADLLADEYGLPLGERQLLSQKAQKYFQLARRSDRDRQDYMVVRGAFD